MEGNGYYPENEQGYGDGWGNNSRRNTSAQGGLYNNESYMQRGLYYDASASYGGDIGSVQRMSGYPVSTLGATQRMPASTMYGSDIGTQRMTYPYGEMDVSNTASQRDTSYGGAASYGTASSYGSVDQTPRRPFDDYSGSGQQQSTFKQRGDATVAQKRILSNYESDMALMQGGSYAGSSPYGKETTKRRNEEETYTTPQQGGNFNSLGQKGSVTYKAVAPPEVGAFAYEYDKFAPPKRQFGVRDFDSGSRKSVMFDDSRYRLGSGNTAGGGAGRGRGRGNRRNVMGGDNWQNKGEKRNDSSYQQGGPYPKKKKNPAQGIKNPVSFLNEIRPDASFIVNDMEGPSNMPTFKVSLEFDGETYTASARSKKLAKRYVSEAALKVYLKTSSAKQLGYSETQIEFSEGPEEGVTQGNHVTPGTKPAAPASTPKVDESIGGKNPVMYLNELKKDAVYDLKEETGQAHNKNFIMRVTVNGQQFEGTGQSKKIAKAAAAREALKTLGVALAAMKEKEVKERAEAAADESNATKSRSTNQKQE